MDIYEQAGVKQETGGFETGWFQTSIRHQRARPEPGRGRVIYLFRKAGHHSGSRAMTLMSILRGPACVPSRLLPATFSLINVLISTYSQPMGHAYSWLSTRRIGLCWEAPRAPPWTTSYWGWPSAGPFCFFCFFLITGASGGKSSSLTLSRQTSPLRSMDAITRSR